MLAHEIMINITSVFTICKILKTHDINSLFQLAPVITDMYNYRLCCEVITNFTN